MTLQHVRSEAWQSYSFINIFQNPLMFVIAFIDCPKIADAHTAGGSAVSFHLTYNNLNFYNTM